MAVTLARESIRAIWDEAQPLAFAHHAEVGPLSSKDFCPNPKRWFALEEVDILRAYTIRNEAGELVGYGTMVLDPCHGMYAAVNWSAQDTLYVKPEHRNGFTILRFLKYQDLSLVESDGVHVIYRHAPHTTKLGQLLLHCEYRLNDRGYIRDYRRAA